MLFLKYLWIAKRTNTSRNWYRTRSLVGLNLPPRTPDIVVINSKSIAVIVRLLSIIEGCTEFRISLNKVFEIQNTWFEGDIPA